MGNPIGFAIEMNLSLMMFATLLATCSVVRRDWMYVAAMMFVSDSAWLPPQTHADDSWRLSAVKNAIATGKPSELKELLDKIPDEMVADLTPEWVSVLDRKPMGLDWTVLKTLERGKFAAIEPPLPLLDRLRKYLDHNEAATRAIAVNVLVKLGPHSIPMTTDGLSDRSPRVRTGCVEVLHRLQVLGESDVMTASRDSDTRVRFATIQAIIPSQAEEPSRACVDRLLEMVTDEEIAVAWRATEMLGKYAHRLDTNRVLSVLVPALKRPTVSVAAAQALARMGSDAQPAIPNLLEAFPVGAAHRLLSDDAIENALPRIGIPRVEDIPKLIAMLDGEITSEQECERSIRVLNVLFRAGRLASAAADSLERIALRDAAANQRERSEAADSDLSRDDFDHFEFEISAESALMTLWSATHDIQRFLKIAGEIPSIEPWGGSDVLSSMPMNEQIVLMTQFLTSQKIDLVNIALKTINDSTKPWSNAMIELQPLLRSILSDEPPHDQARFEAYLNTLTSESVDPSEMLRWLKNEQLDLSSFARTAKRLGLRQSETLSKLREGIYSNDWNISTSCIDTYLSLDPEPEKEAANLWMRRPCDPRRLLDWLVAHQSSDTVLLPLVLSQLENSDYWVKIRAIECLGNMGRAAEEFLPSIQKILEKEGKKRDASESEICLACIHAMCQITGDYRPLDDLVEQLTQPRERGLQKYEDGRLMRLLERSQRLVHQHADLIFERLKRCTKQESRSVDSNELDWERGWMKLAKSAGTAQAIEYLQELTRSKDCLLAAAAKEVLNEN
jgi:hypothetical protein